MSAIQGMLLLCFRISKLVEENQDDIGMISMAKAWITERGREVVRMGREVCGGNGLLHENYVIRALADMEATYTYEGTYDINVLIAGRQITGNAAFKWSLWWKISDVIFKLKGIGCSMFDTIIIYNFWMKTFEGEAKLKDLPPITKEYEYLAWLP